MIVSRALEAISHLPDQEWRMTNDFESRARETIITFLDMPLVEADALDHFEGDDKILKAGSNCVSNTNSEFR